MVSCHQRVRLRKAQFSHAHTKLVRLLVSMFEKEIEWETAFWNLFLDPAAADLHWKGYGRSYSEASGIRKKLVSYFFQYFGRHTLQGLTSID